MLIQAKQPDHKHCSPHMPHRMLGSTRARSSGDRRFTASSTPSSDRAASTAAWRRQHSLQATVTQYQVGTWFTQA